MGVLLAAGLPPHRAEAGGDYQVTGLRRLLPAGGRVAWSPAGQWLYYDRLGASGYWEVYRIRPDGTGDLCLTCNRPDLPSRNKGNPVVHPSGRYLVFQVEKEQHAPAGPNATAPGSGRYNDLWVLDLATNLVYRLTDVRRDALSGSLHAQFSRDGSRLLWTDLEGSGGVFGDYRLVIADFVTSPQPSLSNHQYFNPGPQPVWLESQGWGPDGSWIYFSCTPVAGMADENMDLCRMDLATPDQVKRLTFSAGGTEPGQWDEHAKLSPWADALSWMSSMPYGTTPGVYYREWLKTDLWLMTAGGSRRRLTYFNEPGYPEYQGERVVVADHAWSPDGTKIALYLQFFQSNRNEVWLLELTRS
jgi:Tol biopolymer transport system component